AARGIRAQLSVLVRVQQRSWLVARGILADFAQAHEFYQNANVAVIPFQDRGEVGALDPQQAGALDDDIENLERAVHFADTPLDPVRLLAGRAEPAHHPGDVLAIG